SNRVLNRNTFGDGNTPLHPMDEGWGPTSVWIRRIKRSRTKINRAIFSGSRIADRVVAASVPDTFPSDKFRVRGRQDVGIIAGIPSCVCTVELLQGVNVESTQTFLISEILRRLLCYSASVPTAGVGHNRVDVLIWVIGETRRERSAIRFLPSVVR